MRRLSGAAVPPLPQGQGAEQVSHSLVYTYRRKKQANFRKLWIQRINAAARAEALTYNRFILG